MAGPIAAVRYRFMALVEGIECHEDLEMAPLELVGHKLNIPTIREALAPALDFCSYISLSAGHSLQCFVRRSLPVYPANRALSGVKKDSVSNGIRDFAH